MDSLIAIGAGAAILYGIFAIYRIGYAMGHGDMMVVHQYAHDLYFESAGTILTLITIGKYLETKSKGKTSEAITKLLNLAPKTVTAVRDGVEQVVDAADVETGEIFLVKPGVSCWRENPLLTNLRSQVRAFRCQNRREMPLSLHP